ncbi:MAG: ATP-dependent Clp protease ATP-binding subunit [Paludibacteraceae bacterium]|nr:ATP-dependent Clp protease ATP-binding subunit [Paludibacteraceae bacterium]
MNNNLSLEVSRILEESLQQAKNLSSSKVSSEHLMLAMLVLKIEEIEAKLWYFGIAPDELRSFLEHLIEHDEKNVESPAFSTEIDRILRLAQIEQRVSEDEFIKPIHIFLATLRTNHTQLGEYLSARGMSYDRLKDLLMKNQIENTKKQDVEPSKKQQPLFQLDQDDDDDDDIFPFAKRGAETNSNVLSAKVASSTTSETPFLDRFTTDLTEQARTNLLDPMIGREIQVQRLAQILSRRKKNNPVLIGEAGVGKSSIVEGLATKIVKREVPRSLWNKRLLSLDMAAIVAGTKYRGQFEERIQMLLKEMTTCKNVILFIDEIHTMVGAGNTQGSMDAANMLKPALAKGQLQCIGATTMDEYRKSIEKDAALERRFQKIIVDPTTPEETLNLLMNIKHVYEDFHSVVYTEEAIKACVRLSERYMSDRAQPDKAIDVLDEVASRARAYVIKMPDELTKIEAEIETLVKEKNKAVQSQNFEKAADLRDQEVALQKIFTDEKLRWESSLFDEKVTITEEMVAEVVSMMTGVPAHKMAQTESHQLIQLPNILSNLVIGQSEAIAKISKAIQRNRAGLKDPNRPIGSFIFLGPTGVGKTLLAQTLSDVVMGSRDALIRIDMSEYMEKYSVSRLVGAPPGYVGYEEGGQLTERVRRKPYSVILLDEIEKANADVFNLLLQVLDEGRLTDGLGREVDFRNTIIIMTSNAGTRQLKEFGSGVGFDRSRSYDGSMRSEQARSVIQKELKRIFAPEFLNRVDEVVIFDQLSKENIRLIVDLEIEKIQKRLFEMGYKLVLSDEVKDWIGEKGYDPHYGARPIKRLIQSEIEDRLSDFLLRGELKQGKIDVGLKQGVVTIKQPVKRERK